MDSLSGTSSAVWLPAHLPSNAAATLMKPRAPTSSPCPTRAGAEAVAHSLQLETDTDPNCAILSFDGIGAFVFVSRQAMLSELQHTPEGSAMLPFVRLFYGAVFLCVDRR